MRRFHFWLPLALAILLGLRWWSLQSPGNNPLSGPKEVPPVEADALSDKTPPGDVKVQASAALIPGNDIPPQDQPAAGASAAGPRELRAYRMILEGGQVRLEAVEDIQGDFRARRGPPSKLAGMLCCQLMDAAGTVLAEETVAAPDLACVVLDPHLPGSDGRPQAAQFSPAGPRVFQVRLPKTAAAETLRVLRLTSGDSNNSSGASSVLASIPLPK